MLFPVDKIASKARELAQHSWEYGAISHALLEIYDPNLCPFFGPIPDKINDLVEVRIPQARGLLYAKEYIRTDQSTLIDGKGSAADPASLGTAAILLGKLDPQYTSAARRLEDFLMNDTPRFANDAISHREHVAELWSDFMFMAPPFLAHYALETRDAGLLQEVVRQCELQREVLQDRVKGLWQHVVGPQKPDPGLWSTGNGWAVCGLVRVYAVVKKFQILLPEAVPYRLESELKASIQGIIRGAVSFDTHENGLLRNYLDDKMYSGEKAGTAAIASAVLRMAVLNREIVSGEEIAWAERMAELVLVDVAEDGSVGPVCNPLTSRDQEPQSGSAEGQAFALYLIAALRDWKSHETS